MAAQHIHCSHSKLKMSSRDRKDPMSLFNVPHQSPPSIHSAPLPVQGRRTRYDFFIIPLIISPFIHLSDRIRPPPLRCLIGEQRPEVQQPLCQMQQTDLSGPCTAASKNEQATGDGCRLETTCPNSKSRLQSFSGPV